MITIGYPQTNSATGTTKVFKYDTSWNQIGSNIDGSATGDHAGTSVVIDGSGDFVAIIGSPFAGDASAEKSMYIKMFPIHGPYMVIKYKYKDKLTMTNLELRWILTQVELFLLLEQLMVMVVKEMSIFINIIKLTSSWNKVGGDLSGNDVGDLTGTTVKGELNQLGTEVTVGEPGSNNTFYYTPWTYASQTQLDWNFLFDGSTSVTSSISGHVGTML